MVAEENFNVELLQDSSIGAFYQQRMDGELDETFGLSAIEIYKYIKEKTKKIAREVLGIKEQIKKSYVISDEIKLEIEEKKEAYHKWLNSKKDEHRVAYINLRNNLKYKIRTLKNETWEKRCADINSQLGYNRSREAWRLLKIMRSNESHKAHLNFINLEGWTMYYSQLLQEQRQQFMLEEEDVNSWDKMELEVSEEEIQKILRDGKNGKSPGPGGINLELLKSGGGKIIKLITRLINTIIKEGTIPKEMATGYISSIFKKGDRKLCSNYRGICVTNPFMKILGKVIRNRLENEFETSETQCGFTSGRSCIDQLFIIRQLLQKSHEKLKDIHMIFIDLEKAYDSVPRILLWKALEIANINKCTINLVKLMYSSNTCQVKVGNKRSEEFKTSKGLLQGCCMSPTLFKIYVDVVLSEWSRKCEKMGVKLMEEKYLFNLLFADDQVIISQDEDDVEYMMRKLKETYTKWGLNINYEKTEYLTSGLGKDLEVDGKIIKNVENFKYLGSQLQIHGETDMEISRRVSAARGATSQLNSLLWSQNILNKTKKIIFKTIIESILLYGSETWTIRKTHEDRILATEMDFWRRASRTSRLERKTNMEIRNKMGIKKNIIQTIDERRLRWFGHVSRMNEKRLPRIMMKWKVEGKNRRGRPKKKWQDNLLENLNRYNLKPEDTHNRELWKGKLKKIFG